MERGQVRIFKTAKHDQDLPNSCSFAKFVAKLFLVLLSTVLSGNLSRFPTPHPPACLHAVSPEAHRVTLRWPAAQPSRSPSKLLSIPSIPPTLWARLLSA